MMRSWRVTSAGRAAASTKGSAKAWLENFRARANYVRDGDETRQRALAGRTLAYASEIATLRRKLAALRQAGGGSGLRRAQRLQASWRHCRLRTRAWLELWRSCAGTR